MQETEQGPRKRKERSPSYPGIDLRTAIERAEVVRAHEGRNWAPVDTVLGHWGYSPKSGPGLVTVAALKKFGLMDEQGSGDKRAVRLTDLARAILLDDRPDSPDRRTAIHEAALSPPVHAELWQEYDGSLPSDSNLSYQLRVKRGFTDTAARTFIEQFKDTLAFAGLLESGSISRDGEGKPTPRENPSRPSESHSEPKNQETPVSDTRTIQLPLSLTEWASLSAAFPLTETKWKQMLAVLQAMKPALVNPVPGEKEPLIEDGSTEGEVEGASH